MSFDCPLRLLPLWLRARLALRIRTSLTIRLIQGVAGYLKEPNLLREAAHGVLDARTSYARGDVNGVLKAGVALVKDLANTPEKRETFRRTMTSPADVIQLSGCKDYQTSADTMEGVRLCVVWLMIGTTYRGDELGIPTGSFKATAAEL
jgi:hypothetical protein